MTDPIYRIVRLSSTSYAVEIGPPELDDGSIRRAIAGFRSEGEAKAWIARDTRSLGHKGSH